MHRCRKTNNNLQVNRSIVMKMDSAPNTNDKKVDVGSVWWFWFSTNAFAVDKRLRRVMRTLPRDPRCKFCNTPFQGFGGTLARVLFGKQRSTLNPRYCNQCEI